MKTLAIILLSLCSLQISAQNTPADQYNSKVARDWFSLELDLVKNGTGFTPPVAARAMGYTGLALYESIVAGIPGYGTLEGELPDFYNITDADDLLEYHWPTVANNALALVIDSLFSNATQAQKDSIHARRNAWNTLFQGQVSSIVFYDSRALGEQIASEVFAYSKTDGGYKSYLSNFDPNYIPPTGTGIWEPTPPGYAMALQPYWGNLRPLVLEDTMPPCIPAPPPAFSEDTNSAFYAYSYQVYMTVKTAPQAQKYIAQYWADGPNTVTPPGHSISILTQVLRKENSDLAYAAIAYAKLGMSQLDAFISCWRTKYKYNLLRPVTYIRKYIDSTWSSSIGTPPFPEYTSGHSTQSGAMTAVMNDLFGTNYAFTDSTHGNNYGGPRSFGCFDEAAYEAATSRLFGGIHYEFSDVIAISLGKSIGENINALFRKVEDNSTGIEAPEAHASFTAYPNPARSYTLLGYSGFKIEKIEVYDLSGKLVLTSNNPYVLDLSTLQAGAYFLQVFDRDNDATIQKQIVRVD